VIQHFIALEKIRFKHRLEVNVNMEGDFTNRKIVPLLILPLVENAFKHGVAKLMEDAWINIDAKVKDDKFIFKISNNKPIASQSRVKDAEYGNIGLLNIKKRLSILYPKTHKLKVIDEDDVFIVLLELSKL
jgi:sensor histidine kinase YesM